MAVANRAYVKDLGRCFGPVYLPGEEYTFYINAAVSDPAFASFQLNLIDAGGSVVAANVAALQRVYRDVINYNIYAQFIFPAVGFGLYRLQIVDAATGLPKATSSPMYCEEPEMAGNTAMLTYRHSVNKGGFLYEALPGFYNRVRYPVTQKAYDIQQELNQYRNVSNKKLRNLSSVYVDDVFTLESQKFNNTAHRVIAGIYEHDTIFIDGTFITPKTAYQIEGNPRSVLSNGSVNVVADGSRIAPVFATVPIGPPQLPTGGRIFSSIFSDVFG